MIFSHILTTENVSRRWRTLKRHWAGFRWRIQCTFCETKSRGLRFCTHANLYSWNLISSWRNYLTVWSEIVRAVTCLRENRLGDFKNTYRTLSTFSGVMVVLEVPVFFPHTNSIHECAHPLNNRLFVRNTTCRCDFKLFPEYTLGCNSKRKFPRRTLYMMNLVSLIILI